MVAAAVQSSIVARAAIGGLIYGMNGVSGVFITAAYIMLSATLIIAFRIRVSSSTEGAQSRAFH
jgi:hypothetical protein